MKKLLKVASFGMSRSKNKGSKDKAASSDVAPQNNQEVQKASSQPPQQIASVQKQTVPALDLARAERQRDMEEKSSTNQSYTSDKMHKAQNSSQTTHETAVLAEEKLKKDAARKEEANNQRDENLERAINDSMDFLANEGLNSPGLFKEKCSEQLKVSVMQAILAGKQVDFISMNNAALATTILEECFMHSSSPIFPVKLLDPLYEAMCIQGVKKSHARVQSILLEAIQTNTLSPVFLNLLGLLNLVVQHSDHNHFTLHDASEHFARFMAQDKQQVLSNGDRNERATQAAVVLKELIEHVYTMFPSPNAQEEPSAGAASADHQQATETSTADDEDAESKTEALETHANDNQWVHFPEPERPSQEEDATAPVESFDEHRDDSLVSSSDAGQDVEQSLKQPAATGEEDAQEEFVPVDFTAIAKFNYDATESDELTLRKGDKIKLTHRVSWDHDTDQGWYIGRIGDRSGHLPSTHIQIVYEDVFEDEGAEPMTEAMDAEAGPASEPPNQGEASGSDEQDAMGESEAPSSQRPQLADMHDEEDKETSVDMEWNDDGKHKELEGNSKTEDEESLVASLSKRESDKESFELDANHPSPMEHEDAESLDLSRNLHLDQYDVLLASATSDVEESQHSKEYVTATLELVDGAHPEIRGTEVGGKVPQEIAYFDDLQRDLIGSLFDASCSLEQKSSTNSVIDDKLKRAWKDALTQYVNKNKSNDRLPKQEAAPNPRRLVKADSFSSSVMRMTKSARIKDEEKRTRIEQLKQQSVQAASAKQAASLKSQDTKKLSLQTEVYSKTTQRPQPRPWRNPPSGFKASSSQKVPRYVDPDVVMERWRKEWEEKVMNDPDVKFPSAADSSSYAERLRSFSHSLDGSDDKPVEQEASTSLSLSLSQVHQIRESQRERIKEYNRALVSTPRPKSRPATSRHSDGGSSVTVEQQADRRSERARSLSAGRARLEDAEVSDGDRKPRKRELMSENAAVRHIARQRAAWERQHEGRSSSVEPPSKNRAPAPAEAADKPNQATVAASKALRLAGTAANAKRGIKRTPGKSPKAADAPALAEKFHMLEAHLQRVSPIQSASLNSAEPSKEKLPMSHPPADLPVDYLFKEDAPVSGLPHVDPSSSASIANRASGSQRFSSSADLSVTAVRRADKHDLLRRDDRRGPAQSQEKLTWSVLDASSSSKDDPARFAQEVQNLIDAVGVVSLHKRPLEPLLSPPVAAGLEHALRKDSQFLDGPFRPQLRCLETVGAFSLPKEPLPTLVLPCGALIWRSDRGCETYTTFLPEGTDNGVYLHCYSRYREEMKEGMWIPEAIFVASRTQFHASILFALTAYASNLPASVPWDTSHVKELISILAMPVPLPGQPLHVQMYSQIVHVQRPSAKELPLADIDFAVLFRCLDLVTIRRVLLLLLLGEPQLLVVADDASVLFPILEALKLLLFPFEWPFTMIPILPINFLTELDSPFPFLLGVTRPALPRGRVPSNVSVLDTTHKTLSIPPALSALERSSAGVALARAMDERLLAFEERVLHVLQGHAACDPAKTTNDEIWAEAITAPGTWKSLNENHVSPLQTCVDVLRNNLLFDLVSLVFRFPLFVQNAVDDDAVMEIRQKKLLPPSGTNVVHVDTAGLVGASEEPEILEVLCRTRMFNLLVAKRMPYWEAAFGLRTRGKGARKARAGDLVETYMRARLEAEAHEIANLETIQMCGFLFVQEDRRQQAGTSVQGERSLTRSERSHESGWQLKWCELDGLSLKMLVFQSPAGPAPSVVGGEASEDDVVFLLEERETFINAFEDPTSFNFEISVRGQGSVQGSGQDVIRSLRICAKDAASRTSWIKHIRARCMGPEPLHKLAEMVGTHGGGTDASSPQGPRR
ncbi:hypothetical protein GUITHDRAFT_102963 [Guillardia theta CCMP2712]|uniref:UDENN domain-containing protein n=1 Tax=Guillardia theta (strain CCMP2712) TaxID=905079 RepID=L1JS70_GUITC|nr:hypothetical protein GUITHDRAFT_102963 [Guillardia theta CCMP2712]EKX51040.1 hypothetical protein GUITHDRAFT_102963 [Guillardia theta CCMP2712]|eukprot:XP_005838020.1 hypothetical protein GUITHDRAFT_102963 [Guillardia theta CCMP2712]